jgi:glyoxylase-like metal-dependent hydrolase (beta-lactamase superfamily II)
MRLLADGVWQLEGFPRDMFNIYLLGDVLVDTGTRWAQRRIFRQLGERRLRMVALTHCHPDHQGSAHAICQRYGVPLACHEADVAATEGKAAMVPDRRIIRAGILFWAGPPCAVGQVLRDGDEVAGFRVIHAPGHTPGHVMFFRESDGVALAGDVLANIHFITRHTGLREPPPFFSHDAAQNRQSIRLLASLRPRLACFGHGPPVRDPEQIARFAEQFSSG